MFALLEQSQQQVALATELEKTADFELDSELKQNNKVLEDLTKQCEGQRIFALNWYGQTN
eukprot:11848870-Prorocentrum_lima.AAC.1